MLYSRQELERHARQYCATNAICLQQVLGYGAQGVVYSTDRESAIKAHWHAPAYRRERDVYLRLREHGVTMIHGLNVPLLVKCDDELLIIEMGRVSTPFVLDFAAAYLDEVPDFPVDPVQAEEDDRDRRDAFGPHWSEVQRVVRAFAAIGVYMTDIHPGNIRFRE
jgi:hypothetical protein